MKRGTFTNFFPKSLSLVIVSVLFSWVSYGQTFDPIPDLCNTGSTIDLYDYVDPDGGTFAIIPGATPGLVGHTFDPSVAGAGSYTIRWTHSHVGPGHIDQSVTVVSAPTAPTTINSSPDKFCEDQGGNIQLSAIGGSGTTLHWYNDFPGGNEVGTGNPITITAPTVSTTYYAVWENACGYSLDKNYTVLVYPVSASDMAINGIDSPYCSDDPDDLLSGNPAIPTWSNVFTFSGPAAGFTDNGDGTGTFSPTSLPNGSYNLTYEVSKDNCHHSITETINVLPPLVVSFAGLTSPVCIDWGTQLLTGNHAPGGTFSGPGITDNGNGTAIFDPSAAGAGTHTITYSYTDGNSCTSSDSQVVIVNALPSLSFGVLDNDYCLGDGVVTLTGSEAPNGTYTINGLPGPLAYFVDNGDGTADFDPTTAGVGNYQIDYEYTDANTCTNTASRSTEVHAILVPTISGNANPCQNVEITYTTETGMNNYNWVISAGGTVTAGGTATDHTVTVNWDNTGAQTVQITYDDSNGGCTSTTATKNITVKPEPTVTLDPFSAVCLGDAAFTLTGGHGLPAGGSGVYSGTGVSGGNFDPGTAGPGTHTITYTYTAANTCSNSDSEDIDVLDLSASCSNLDADYCYLHADETIVGNNTDGAIGTFSISPVPVNGAMFTDNGNNTATFSPNNCDASDYNTVFTITYTYTNGTCSASDNTASYVYGSPTVTINGLAGNYCSSDGIDAFTGTPANGTFSTTATAGLTDDGAGNGTFDPNAAGAAGSPYTISYYYADPSGCDNTAIENVTVNQTPDPTLTSSDADNTICAGASVTFTATDNEAVADTWEFLIDGANAQGPGASNTYTTSSLNNGEVVKVIASVGASSCSATSTGIATIVVPAPTPTFVSGDVSVCEGDVGLVYETQAGMNNYVWAVVGGNITSGGTAADNTATVTWNTPGAQSISVNYENANGCAAASATILNVTVTALPDNTLAVSDDEVCEGEVGIITLSGSELGVTYQLRNDADDSSVGAAINGTGGDINFADNPLNTTTYNIIASNSNGCVIELLDKPVITINPLPNPGLICSDVDLTICQNESVSFTASGGDTYEFFVDGASVQGPAASNIYTSSSLVDGETVTVEVSWSATSCYDISSGITMTVLPLPNPTLTGDQDVCLNESGVVYTTDAGMSNYSWSVVGGTVDAGGGVSDNTVTVTWTSLGAQSVSVNYDNANNCHADASTILPITVNPLPDNSLALSDDEICNGETATIVLGASVNGVTYQLRLNNDNTHVGVPYNGTGGDLNFTANPVSTTEYNILGTDGNGCASVMIDVSTVTVNPLPIAGLVSSDADNVICQGESISFTASGGDSYAFFVDGNSVQGPGTSDVYITTSLNDGETVTASVTNTTTTCQSTSLGITTTVNALPNPTLTGDQDVCLNESGVVYTTDAGMSNYSWSVVGGTVDAGGGVSDNTVTVTWTSLGAQSVSVNYEDGNSCQAAADETLAVNVNDLPDGSFDVSDPIICLNEVATIELSGSEIGVDYQLRLNSDDSNVGSAVSGTGSTISFNVSPASTTSYNVLATSSASCTTELGDLSTVIVNALPNDALGILGSTICYGDAGTITIEASEFGVSYQLRLNSDDSNVGVPLVGTGGDLIFNVAPSSTTTYNILATNGNFCSTEMATLPVITVNPLPDITLVVSDDEICLGETASIILFNSIPSVEYQMRLNSDDSDVGSSQTGNGSDLLFSVSPITSTTYNILATDGNNCSAEIIDLAVVQVNPLPNNTLNISSPSICIGENAVITLESSVPGVTYQLRLDSDNSNMGAAVPGNGGDITFSVSPTTTTVYNVLATSSAGCSDELITKSTVTVFDAPADNLVVDDDEICYGETASVVLYNSEIGVTYQLRLDSDNSNVGTAVTGTGGNIVFNVAPVSTTLYNVYAYNSNACATEILDKPTITVNPLPNNTLTLGDDAICEGETADIVLYNSILGVNYQLRLDSDNSNIGSSQSGNGGSLIFHDSPSSTTTYNILAIDPNGCSNELIDKSIVQVYPLANVNLTVSDPIICYGENAVISVSNSETGVSYQLRLDSDNSNVGAAVPGNNGTITFDVAPLTTTLFNVLATTSNSCDVELIDRALVTVNPTPDETLAVSSPTICNGETAEIVVYTSEVGVSYQLRLDSDNTTVGVPVAGNGGNISFYVNPIASTTYNILATGGNTCSVELNNKSDVTVYPLPDPTLLSDDATICNGETASIILNNSENGVNYQLRLDSDDSPVGAVLVGTGGNLVFNVSPIISTVYNIYATTSNACSQELYDKPVVTVLPSPNLNLSISDDEICYGETATIVLNNSELGVSYQLRKNTDNSLVGSPISGTGFDIEFNVNPLASEVYNVLATNSNACSGTLVDLSSVTVHSLPSKPVITASGPTTFCNGENVDLSSSAADAYLWNTGETSQTITVDTSGTYSLTVTDANGCISPQSDPVAVTVLPLPVVNILNLDPEYCHDAAAVIITGDPLPGASSSGSFSGPGITDNGDGTAIFDPVAAGIGGPYNIEYTYTNANSCTNSIIQTIIVNEAPSISFNGLDAEYCVDHGFILITGSEAPEGSFSGLGITDNGDGTANFDPGVAGIGGPYTISYNYTNPFGCSNTYTGETTVNPLPTVTFGVLNSEYCVDHDVVTLTGNHAPQGSFTGVGVFDNGDGTATFDPSAAGVGGPYAITYTYSDGNTCTNSSTQETTIHDLPIVNFSGLGTDYCVDASSVTLVGNHMPDGFFTGPGITDNGDGTAEFTPGLAGVGANQAITYTYSDPNYCINSKTKTVNVHALPLVDILNLQSNYCVNDPDVAILGDPTPTVNSSGFFTGSGITDNGDGTALFSPSTLTENNIYTITYSFVDSNSCENSVFEDVNIIELPNAPIANDVTSCFGEPVPNLVATGLPGYQIVWYNSVGDSVYSGNTYPTGLTAVGDYEFYVSQVHPVTDCESDMTMVTLSIVDLPEVSMSPFADVCIYDLIIYLNNGTPAGGVYSGNPGVLELPSGDYIFHPELAGPGTHDIIYTYEDPVTGCQDTAMKTITVHDRPDVSIVDLEDVYCVNGTDVTINGNHPGYGSFSGPGITDNGDGSAIFSPSIADIGTHQIIYQYQDINTTCINQDTVVTTVEGPPESVVSIQISDPEICADAGGTVTLEAIGGDGTWVNWFKGSCGGSDLDILSANGDSSLIVIPAPTTSTYYYAQWETECGVSEFCAEDYIVVTQIPTTPDTSWVTPPIICNNDQDSVALYITGGNYGTILEWTQDSCTGQVVGQTNGDPLIIPSPDTTTKYFARWINDCGESECTESIRVMVTQPAEEVVVADADSNYFCINTLDKVELRAFGGRGDTIIWYYDSLGYDPIPLDSIISINQPLGDTIEIIPPTVQTNYYPFRATPCEQVGGNVSVDLFVFDDPVAVDSAFTMPSVVCFGSTDSITLVAEGGGGETLEWYKGSCENGVFLGNGNNFKIFPPDVTTQYFARWTTPCGVSACFETMVEIYPPTTDPIEIASDTNEICAGNLDDIQLVMVGGSGDSVLWFSDACGGTPLDGSTFYYQSENADTIVIPAPTTDTTFYAQWATLCEVSECVSIDITVYPQPVMVDTVFTNYNNFCSGSVANITLTALGGSGDQISWTSGSCDGPVVAVTNQQSITIPAPMDTTVYFAKWKTLCDSTECQSVQVNVPPTPQDPDQIHIAESLICDNAVDSITLILQGGSGYEAVWFYGPYCGNDTIPEDAIHKLSAKGDSIRIARPAQSLVITANWASFNSVCGSSECVSTEVFVYEAPSAFFEVSGGEPCENTLLQFAPDSDPGSGLINNLHWDFGDGTEVDTNLQVFQYHLYEDFGLYEVSLIATNTYGCEDTLAIPLDISEAPEALFSYSASCLGEPVQFMDESISAVDSIAAWFWDFGDASSINDTSTLQNPTYAYQQAGIYEVTLVVTDTSGCSDQIIQEVNIAPKPTAYFQLETASCQSVPVFFNDSSYTNFNEIGTWIWNFGDGSADSIITAPNNPDIWYTYHTNGDFTVSLTVIDTSGCFSETFYQYFEVRPQPIAGFMYSDTACQTGIINFFDTSYHEPGTEGEAWNWSFGDGSFAYQQNPVHSYIETGQFYDVQMIVTDEYGCQDTVAHEIEVKPELQISFSSNVACQGEATELVANIIQPEGGSVVEWEWYFGDNSDTIVTEDTVYHTYPSGGTFYATLTGKDEGGCENIVINQAVLVNPAPLVDFFIPEASCNDPSIFYDHSVGNADSITNYHFDYGDGTYENFTSGNYNDPIEHIYPAGANEYTATITLVNSNGCESVQEFIVERESCITLAFDVQSPACVNQELMFVNHSTINNEEVTIDSIIWNFGDGVIYELPIEEGDTVYHSYSAAGLMDIQMSLLATNQLGDFANHMFRNIYVNETPNAEFTVDQNLLCSRDSIQFTDHSWVFNGDIVAWQWEFGDEMTDTDTSSLQHPQFWYSYAGDYTPTLIAISDSGCMSSFEKEISLEPSPVNHLFANVEYGCGPQNEILFRDTAYLSSGNIDYYQWIFGFNDTVYTEVDSLWHQLNIGEYSVISRVVSDIGCAGMDSLTGFNVYDKPIARFGYYPDDPSIREPEVFFNDQSIGAESQIEYYHWNFGDNSDTVGLDPVHIYQDTGTFNVLLTIQDRNACVDTISHSLYVDPVFSFYMPNAFSPNGNGLNDEFGPIGSYFDDTDYEFEIYSRWGELLFETKDPYEYWKGDFSITTKNPVPLGVYSWIIRVEDALGDEHVYKGQVTVVR